MTYCDPTMDINTTADVRTIMGKYEDRGIPMEPSINNREQFASALHNMLGEQAGDGIPRLQCYVNPTNKRVGAPYLARTIPQMRYDPKNTKKMDDHRDDHGVVALCYYVLSHAADNRAQIMTPSQMPRWMRPKKNDNDRRILGRENVRDRR